MKKMIILLCLIGAGITLIGWQWGKGRSEEKVKLQESKVKVEAAEEETPKAYVGDLEPFSSGGKILRDINLENHLLSINGVKYERGLCVNSPSDVTYDIGEYTRFRCVIGHHDDYPEYEGYLTFIIFVDGKKVYESKPLGARDSEEVDISVEGGKLTLLVKDSGLHTQFAVWADACLF